MNYLFAFLSFIATWLLSIFVSLVFGRLTPLLFGALGYFLAANNLLIGVAVLVGSMINQHLTGKHLKKMGAMSNVPRISHVSSWTYIWLFFSCSLLIHVFGFDIGMRNQWVVIGFVLIGSLFIMYWGGLLKSRSLHKIKKAVSEYAIVEKYEDGHRWAIYLYLKNGREVWNKTIPGSFMARDPENDLTFVFPTEEEALSHAENIFPDAKRIDLGYNQEMQSTTD